LERESAESAESAKQKNDVAEVAEKWVLKDNLCHLCHLCQCKFLYKRHGMPGNERRGRGIHVPRTIKTEKPLGE
jgi:hypothetical protein